MPDIRDIAVVPTASPVRELPGAVDFDSALKQVALGFGLQEYMDTVWIDTPYVPVIVRRRYLLHIVEKRPNARERFTEFAVDTVRLKNYLLRLVCSQMNKNLKIIHICTIL
ncbi:hypothetical protein [Pseudomonas sp. A25(2017)]|uniref:hypothetical protein n=1 Tax=Pseudomonas sp. A25(2017) TaxID=1945865 RepID=UPI0009865240|nr:hypothetical protein [Pseudomonas sp. A25(2017)]